VPDRATLTAAPPARPASLQQTPSQTVGPFLALGLPWPDGPFVVPEGSAGAITIAEVLSRMTEVLFVEVLRSWIKSLGHGEGGWLGAIADRYIGKALQLIHEHPEQPWTLSALGRHVGLGRSAFAARFTRLVGQPVYRYLVARRMDEAALMLESGDDAIARIATRVGYETTTAFSKAFKQHYSFSPGRYRARSSTGPLGSPHLYVSASP
jgi:AraC-like DNA-binding protein